MRALVTGATGMLGRALVGHLEAAGDVVVGVGRDEVDVTSEPQVWAAVRDVAPDLVFHLAAWTDVDGCEADPDRAHRANAIGSWWVARACDATGAVMVTVSSDYVFGGHPTQGDPRPYTEFDALAPANAYGRSKAAAETLVRRTLREHHIVRTSWLNGAGGGSFVEAMLRRGREEGRARVVDDQVGSPTFVADLVPALREVAVSGRYGTWHRTNTGVCSWYELTAALYDEAGIDVDLERITSAELDRPAPRPAYSVLSNRHAELSGLTALPHWRDGLRRLVAELAAT